MRTVLSAKHYNRAWLIHEALSERLIRECVSQFGEGNTNLFARPINLVSPSPFADAKFESLHNRPTYYLKTRSSKTNVSYCIKNIELICHINAEINQRSKYLREPKDIEECISSNSNVSDLKRTYTIFFLISNWLINNSTEILPKIKLLKNAQY